VFPDPNNHPTLLAESSIDDFVSFNISSKFQVPECRIISWPIRMTWPWAGVPEAAVHENGDALPWKNEVWFTEKTRIAPPAGDPQRAEYFY